MPDFRFLWAGGSDFDHLRVRSFRGREALSTLFAWEIDLVERPGIEPVSVDDLAGKPAMLVLRAHDGARVVHGVLASAEQLGDDAETHFRVQLVPAFWQATMTTRSHVWVDRTLKQVVEDVLMRADGARMERASPATNDDSGDDGGASAPADSNGVFCWRMLGVQADTMIAHLAQYNESDWDFVARLLETAGISYHFEHGAKQTVLVFTDHDSGRMKLPHAIGDRGGERQLVSWRRSARMRPLGVRALDYNWRRPRADMHAEARHAGSGFTTTGWPGGHASKDEGDALTRRQLQRLDVERATAQGEGRCRHLSAGQVFQIEGPAATGKFLCTAVRHEGSVPQSFAAIDAEPIYKNRFDVIPAEESHFRPARTIHRTQIVGTQTAVVTADPSAAEAPINVGDKIGCVRLRFHWDEAEHVGSPTSGWIRVSQVFGGSPNHGALFSPRVGEEVIVAFLDGDPDKPVVVGRVYNGLDLPSGGNPADSPTKSYLRTGTPGTGKFNEIVFEDLDGNQVLSLSASKDFKSHATHDGGRSVGRNDDTKVGGDQKVDVGGVQSTTVGEGHTVSKGVLTAHSAGDMNLSTDASLHQAAATNVTASAGAEISLSAGAKVQMSAPTIHAAGSSAVLVDAPIVAVKAGGGATVTAPAIGVKGEVVKVVASGAIMITAPSITIKGGKIDIVGSGTVNVSGSVINLNS